MTLAWNTDNPLFAATSGPYWISRDGAGRFVAWWNNADVSQALGRADTLQGAQDMAEAHAREERG
jgi:hypothetical protein